MTMMFPKPKKKKKKPLRERKGMTDADFVGKVHDLPCVICVAFGFVQTTKTTAHHPICGRFSQMRAPDQCCIPLCDRHHQGNEDKRGPAIHDSKEQWMAEFGPDTDYIEATQDAVARLMEA